MANYEAPTRDNGQNASYDDNPKENQGQKPESLGYRALKKTGKAAAAISAVDVLAKDFRRVRPRNPELWKQLFSAEGGRRLKDKLFGIRRQKENGDPAQERVKSLIGSTLSSIISFLAAVYLVRIMAGAESGSAFGILPVAAGFVFFLMAITYGIIAVQFAVKHFATKEVGNNTSQQEGLPRASDTNRKGSIAPRPPQPEPPKRKGTKQ